ncbi:MAG: FAD-dependent oxidoreductase [Deltaproteobacteria bacterium]|nr:FAD-dependent oxidoreductase [Deltaproteobacteria bacterium]
MNPYDVIILGGGPAGSNAAARLAQFKRQVLLIDKGIGEGFTGSSARVQNFPGFPEGISGPKLMERFRQSVTAAGAEIKEGAIESMDVAANPFTVTSQGGESFATRAVILATGAAFQGHLVPGERELRGAGVFSDAHLEGALVAGGTVVVIGKTQEACKEALLLARSANRVYLIVPSSKLDVPEGLVRQLQDKKIEIIFSASLKQVNGTDKVTSVTVLAAGTEKEIQADGVFSYTHDWQTVSAYLKDRVQMTEKGIVMVDDDMATSVKGIFACGDIICGRPQLPAISAAQGILAALSVEKYLGTLS